MPTPEQSEGAKGREIVLLFSHPIFRRNFYLGVKIADELARAGLAQFEDVTAPDEDDPNSPPRKNLGYIASEHGLIRDIEDNLGGYRIFREIQDAVLDIDRPEVSKRRRDRQIDEAVRSRVETYRNIKELEERRKADALDI